MIPGNLETLFIEIVAAVIDSRYKRESESFLTRQPNIFENQAKRGLYKKKKLFKRQLNAKLRILFTI